VVEPANESACSLPFMPICPGVRSKKILKDRVLRDSSNARTFRIIGEHLERKGLLTIAKILARQNNS